MRAKGFSLVELLIVCAVLAMLCAMLVPSLSAARAIARRGACSAQLHAVGAGLVAYANQSRMCLPPFAFSTGSNDLMLSGHWGGADQPIDRFCRQGVDWVNLYALVLPELVRPASLTCPAANMKDASFFPRTKRFSTYCMRFPYSPDLFNESPGLANYTGPQLLGVYNPWGGGQMVSRIGGVREMVPLVRLGRRYSNPGTGSVYDTTRAVAADQFEYQDFSQPAAGSNHAVRRTLCHGRQFNILMGDGAVKTATDDGTVAGVSLPTGAALADDKKNYSTYADRVWQFFDRQ